MKKKLTVRLDKNDNEKLLFLYKYFQIPNETDAKRFRKLLTHVSERILHGSQDEKSLGHEEELRLLEGWNCTYRTLIWPYNKYSKKKEPRIFCFNPTTREILKTNELYIPVCKKCHESGGSIKPLFLPEPKQEVSKSSPKQKQVKRKCIVCGDDISKQPDNHQWCRKCYFEMMNPQAASKESNKYGLPGSPMWIGHQQGARLRRLDERMKQQSKEE